MIYTPLTKKAMLFACEKHNGQVDKSGYPYIAHPIHLAEQMDDEISTCVALLHDTVEDTDATIEDIENLFGSEVAEAVALLTRPDDMDYFDYVRRIKANPFATKVKLADLSHNSDLTRLETVREKDIKRTEKYAEARRILTEGE